MATEYDVALDAQTKMFLSGSQALFQATCEQEQLAARDYFHQRVLDGKPPFAVGVGGIVSAAYLLRTIFPEATLGDTRKYFVEAFEEAFLSGPEEPQSDG